MRLDYAELDQTRRDRSKRTQARLVWRERERERARERASERERERERESLLLLRISPILYPDSPSDFREAAAARGVSMLEYCKEIKGHPDQHSLEVWSAARRWVGENIPVLSLPAGIEIRRWKAWHVRAGCLPLLTVTRSRSRSPQESRYGGGRRGTCALLTTHGWRSWR